MLYQTTNPHGGDIYNQQVLLDFSANTNPYGTPKGVIDAVKSALPMIHQYPDPYCRELVKAISDFQDIPKKYILCGNGAAELIYSYCEAVHPKIAVELAPTFAEYSLGLKRVGCKVERYYLHKEQNFKLNEDFLFFLERIKPEVMFLCNPNNPTGKTIDSQLLESILKYSKENHSRLFIDECFLDLSECGKSLKNHLADNTQLFILRAFTKSYGMAGIRLGYAMSSDSDLLNKMSKTVQPWNVSLLSQTAGVAALRENIFLKNTRKSIFTEKKWLMSQLKDMGLWVCSSDANFLLFHSSVPLHTELNNRQIFIRNCDNYYGLSSGWYRIAVRLHHENEKLIAAIRCVLQEQLKG